MSEKPKHGFQKGQSGNPAGRPKGARSKLSSAFLIAMHDDFMRHGAEAIVSVREKDASTYLRVIAMMVPKQVDLSGSILDDLRNADEAEIRTMLAEALKEAGYGSSGHTGERNAFSGPEGGTTH